MWGYYTINYKGYYIHGSASMDWCYVNNDGSEGNKPLIAKFKTLIGAKRAITKLISE